MDDSLLTLIHAKLEYLLLKFCDTFNLVVTTLYNITIQVLLISSSSKN